MMQIPVKGPAVWAGAELSKTDDWITQFTEDDIRELSEAVSTVGAQNLDLFDITKEDFPLPTLGPRIANLRNEIEGGRGFALLRGLPVSHFTLEESRKIIWGLAVHLGYPEPQDMCKSLMHSVTNTGKRVETSESTRGYETDDELKFHNDGGDAFMLLCLKTAREGGISKLMSAGALFNAILDKRPDLARILQEPFYFDARSQNALDKKVQVLPVFVEHDGLLNVLYKRRYIELAQRFDDVPRLTSLQREALDMFDSICADPAMHLAFTMQPGDIQIGNNYSLLHSRTRYQDHEDVNMRRHLLRVWLTLENGRPLPPIYAETREFGPSYARRQNNAFTSTVSAAS
ncbi:taurine catabolism dioxygenase TauD [Allopusillimonas soli]|uniref:TauD/TfdA family dioxygenase n=1 Tax=Allopusillimonas soli TaxID=659016 RepID=A0A853FA36_9BURK|nr:TauD/TfdA family dioxygenase [Allopusillimonas soli]NYT36837.1 TauD/TfdA family dioxygenase [Allopusillimonas soli]TEA75299.1 taurine catabolism dioxygenase TauD [Allopusillimonas soli]